MTDVDHFLLLAFCTTPFALWGEELKTRIDKRKESLYKKPYSPRKNFVLNSLAIGLFVLGFPSYVVLSILVCFGEIISRIYKLIDRAID